ncbi:MAG TPA: ATPase, T2SS/T4P/T4SS family [Candidatus Polarisedimenticolia bacterium]|nr:ATPase, T2SS/T4P/T4SS family [Candidatus Polarisedimenticolia bacterium]
MSREYPTQCWSCLGEFDAVSAIWCSCSAHSASKLCPFCFRCFCQSDAEYLESFWNGAPDELKEERDILKGATGSAGEALIRSNLLSTDQLVSALRWQQNRKTTLEDALVELGFVSRQNLELVVKKQTPAGVHTLDLSKGLVDASLVTTVTVALCYRKKILPITKEEIGGMEVLTLAMAGPTDVETIDQVQSLTNCRVIPMNASESDILLRLQDLFPKEIAALRAGEGADPAPEPATAAVAHPAARAAAESGAGPAAGPAGPRKAPAAQTPARRKRSGASAAAAPIDDRELEEAFAEPPSAAQAAPPAPAARVPEHVAAPPVEAPRPPPAAPVAAAPFVPEEGSAILQTILSEAISKRTSLVQLEIRNTALSLFFRIDGNLYRAKLPTRASAAGLSRALNTVASLPGSHGQAAGRLAVKSGDRRIDVVVRRVPSASAESYLVKIIERADFIRPLPNLGLSAHDLERLRQAMSLPHGLVVLSSPPHNGLQTTRYSLMAQLAEGRRRVLSIDAPQIVGLEGIRQEEVSVPPDAAACRKILASIPGSEIVFLPEIQSAEMADLAVESAASCLVVASIQARRASQAPAAILWHRVDAAALASALKLIVNQRLVRRLCEACRKPAQVSDRVLKMMGLTSDEALDLKVHQATGCDRCGPLSPGYTGRVALWEVLEGTPEIALLVSSGGSPGEIEREGRRAGMSPLRADCLAYVGQGITSLEEFQKGNF